MPPFVLVGFTLLQLAQIDLYCVDVPLYTKQTNKLSTKFFKYCCVTPILRSYFQGKVTKIWADNVVAYRLSSFFCHCVPEVHQGVRTTDHAPTPLRGIYSVSIFAGEAVSRFF